jgi:hypothetical protein
MATASRRSAARRSIKKGMKEAGRQRTIVRLSPNTRKALKVRGVKAARRKR